LPKHEKRLIGYARVSTYGQTLDSQLEQPQGVRRLEEDHRNLMFRPIQKVHLAPVDQCSYQKFRHTGEGRCPWQRWVPAFAGKTGGASH
jgi:hypothetical protein